MAVKGPRTLNAAVHLRSFLRKQGFRVTHPVDKSIEELSMHKITVQLAHPVAKRSDLGINQERVRNALQVLAALHAHKHKTDLMPTHEPKRVSFTFAAPRGR